MIESLPQREIYGIELQIVVKHGWEVRRREDVLYGFVRDNRIIHDNIRTLNFTQGALLTKSSRLVVL